RDRAHREVRTGPGDRVDDRGSVEHRPRVRLPARADPRRDDGDLVLRLVRDQPGVEGRQHLPGDPRAGAGRDPGDPGEDGRARQGPPARRLSALRSSLNRAAPAPPSSAADTAVAAGTAVVAAAPAADTGGTGGTGAQLLAPPGTLPGER